MLGSSYFIAREARRLAERHGVKALAVAHAHIAEYEAQENALAADAWRRIARALGEQRSTARGAVVS